MPVPEFILKWNEVIETGFIESLDREKLIEEIYYKFKPSLLRYYYGELIHINSTIYEAEDFITITFERFLRQFRRNGPRFDNDNAMFGYLRRILKNFHTEIFEEESKKDIFEEIDPETYSRSRLAFCENDYIFGYSRVFEDNYKGRNEECYRLLNYIKIEGMKYNELIEIPEYSAVNIAALRQRVSRCWDNFINFLKRHNLL